MGIGYDSGGDVYVNGSNVQALASWSSGVTIGVCVNVEYQQIWFNVNGGNWNNNASYNPAASPPTGGISLSSLTSSAYFPACGASAASSFTLNATVASQTYSAPSGYGRCRRLPRSPNMPQALKTTRSREPRQACRTHVPRPASEWGGKPFTPGNVGSPLARPCQSGYVKQAGSGVAKIVRVYDQKTGELIEEVTSNWSTGDFTVNCQGRNEVYVVALDPPTYQGKSMTK